jgi:putative transposase
MQLTEQHILNKTEEIDDICFKSKNLYNRSLYLIRQYFFDTNKYIGFKHLSNAMKIEPSYKELPIKVSQLIIKQIHDNFVSFFNANKEYKVNPSKFLGKPAIPHYKEKESGRNLVTYNDQAFSKKLLKYGILNPSGTNLFVPTNQSNIDCVRIVPHSSYISVEIVYTKQEENLNLNKDNVVSIDLGVNNLSAITSNKQDFTPLLVNGRQLKSINQFYNKTKSMLQSLLPKNQYTSLVIDKLTLKRNRRVKHYMHNTSKFIIQLCKDNNIGTIIIGKNDNWKQNCNMRKDTNQNFVCIPFNMLISQIQYKAALIGIDVIFTEESYTSKCSLLDNEEMCHHEQYAGRRVKRGLFKSSNGIFINADIHGSYNIMRKVFPNFYKEYGIEDFVVSPLLCNPCTV